MLRLMEITAAPYLRIEPAFRANEARSASPTCQCSTRCCPWPSRGARGRTAEAFWQLAHHLHSHEPLVQERRVGARFGAVAAGADRAHPDRGRTTGLDQRQGASGRPRRIKKNGPQAIGKSRGGGPPQIPRVAAEARTAITFALSPGQACDAVQGRELLGGLGPPPAPLHLIMDRAYQDNQALQRALDFGFLPVVPPRSNRRQPWQYDKAMYRKRNEIERLFRRLKGFRRIFSRFDKLDVVFIAFLYFSLI